METSPTSSTQILRGHLIVKIAHDLHLIHKAILEEAAEDHHRQPRRQKRPFKVRFYMFLSFLKLF